MSRRVSSLLVLVAGCAHAAPAVEPDASIAQWIDDAFDRLPLLLTHKGGERVRVIWHEEVRPFGTGDTDGEIADLDANAIHLYQPERLSKRAVERAVAYSLMWMLDLEEEWSSSSEWKAQNGWREALSSLLSPFEHAQNLDPRGFADERGRRSPRADLASFAAHYFFPDDVRCRLLSQVRFLTARLRLTERSCAGFERWARLDEIESIEIGLASPSTRQAASLFGHLLLRVLYREGESRVIAFVADVQGQMEEDPFYPVKGLFGGYRARMMERSFEDVYREYIVVEGRDLRRWRINFDAEEIRILLERIWTLERSGAFNYYFLRQNCASLLVELFNSVLPEGRRIDHAGAIGRGPGEALDGFSFAKAKDGGPLITYVPDPLRSFAREAREADRRRSELGAELARASAEAAAAIVEIESGGVERRASAYATLAKLDLPAEKIDRYLADSLAVESHLSSERNMEREQEKAKAQRKRGAEMIAWLREVLPQDLALATSDPELFALLEHGIELLDSLDPVERRLGYETVGALIEAMRARASDRETARRMRMVEDGARLFALLQAMRWWDPRPRNALFHPVRNAELAAQPYVGSFRDLVEYEYVTEVSPALLAIARARRSIGAPRSADREEVAIAEEQLRYESAYPHTGMDMLSLRGSNRGLVIAGALYDEALGERRRHGFAGDTALVIGASDVVWGWHDGRPAVMESQTRILGYRTLRPAFDVVPSLLSRLGWELAIDLQTMREDRARWIRGEVRAGMLLPLFASEDLSDHVLVKAGASVLGQLIDDAEDAGGLGIPVGFEVRWELGPVIANVDVQAAPLIDPWAGEVRLTAGSLCRVRVPIYDRLVLPWRGHVGISFEATARAAYSEIPNAEGFFARVDAGVRIE